MKVVDKLVLVPIQQWEQMKKGQIISSEERKRRTEYPEILREKLKIHTIPLQDIGMNQTQVVKKKKNMMKQITTHVNQNQYQNQNQNQQTYKKVKKTGKEKKKKSNLTQKGGQETKLSKSKDVKALLKFMNEKNLLKWKKSGTNLKNLILHAVSTKAGKKPHGYKIFYKLLAKYNVPEKIINNNLALNIIRKHRMKWRPPGEIIN